MIRMGSGHSIRMIVALCVVVFLSLVGNQQIPEAGIAKASEPTSDLFADINSKWTAESGGFHHVHDVDMMSDTKGIMVGSGIITIDHDEIKMNYITENMLIEGVSIDDSGNGWAIANENKSIDESERAYIIEISDRKMNNIEVLDGYHLVDIDVVGGMGWIAGSGAAFSRPALFRYDGKSWVDWYDKIEISDWRDVPMIEAVEIVSNGVAFALSRMGTIIKFDGSSWKEFIDVPDELSDVGFYDIDVINQDTIWLAGFEIVLYDHGVFTKQDRIDKNGDEMIFPIDAIQFFDSGIGWAVGDLCGIHFYDGKQWERLANYCGVGSLTNIQIVPGTKTMIAVGDDGIILYLNDDGSFDQIAPKNNTRITDIEFHDITNDMWLSRIDGSIDGINDSVIERYKDGLLTESYHLNNTDINDLYIDTDHKIWAVGGSTRSTRDESGNIKIITISTILLFDTTEWKEIESPTKLELIEISGDSRRMVAIGRIGQFSDRHARSEIIEYKENSWRMFRSLPGEYITSTDMTDGGWIFYGSRCIISECEAILYSVVDDNVNTIKLKGEYIIEAVGIYNKKPSWIAACSGYCALYKIRGGVFQKIIDVASIQPVGNVNDIFIINDSLVWAACDGGILRFDGKLWEIDLGFIHHQESFDQIKIRHSKSDLFIVGEFNTIFRRKNIFQAIRNRSKYENIGTNGILFPNIYK